MAKLPQIATSAMCLWLSPPPASLALFCGGFAGGDQTPGPRSVLSFFPQQKDFILYNLTLIFKSPELCFFCLLGLIAFTSLSSERCFPGKLIAWLVLFSSRSLALGEAGQRWEQEMPRLPLGSDCLQGQRPGGTGAFQLRDSLIQSCFLLSGGIFPSRQ